MFVLGSDAAHAMHTRAHSERREVLTDSNYITTVPTGRKVQQTENYIKELNKVYLVVLSKQTYIP